MAQKWASRWATLSTSKSFSMARTPLDKAYEPMIIRFFILQSHYRSIVDFSVEALHAAETALKRLLDASNNIANIPVSDASTVEVNRFVRNATMP